MNYTLQNSRLDGLLQIPPSKSVGHRAIICACLSNEKCCVSNLAFNEDILATIGAMRALGHNITQLGDSIVVEGKNSETNHYAEESVNNVNKTETINKCCFHKDNNIFETETVNDSCVIDCNESGSTLRFLIPIALVCCDKIIKFVGRGKLGTRPLNTFFEIFDKQNIFYKNDSLATAGKKLNLEIGGKLKGGIFKISGDVSSQFLTGLLFALPMCLEDSKIILTSPLQSKGYIDLTIQVLQDFGIEIKHNDYESFVIKGQQKYTAKAEYVVEGDYSQSAFFAVANYLGSNVQLCGLNKNSLQGDKAIFELLEKLKERQLVATQNSVDNFDVKNDNNCVDQLCTAEKNCNCINAKNVADLASRNIDINCVEKYCFVSEKNELIIDGKDFPDIIPIFALACALTLGKTKIINIGRLRIKECDRIMAVCKGLNALGTEIVEGEDFVQINGVSSLCNKKNSTTIDSITKTKDNTSATIDNMTKTTDNTSATIDSITKTKDNTSATIDNMTKTTDNTSAAIDNMTACVSCDKKYENGDNSKSGIFAIDHAIVVDSFNDHRIAMTLAIAALVCKKPITIVGVECVKKSYPNFFEDYIALGGKIL